MEKLLKTKNVYDCVVGTQYASVFMYQEVNLTKVTSMIQKHLCIISKKDIATSHVAELFYTHGTPIYYDQFN